MAQMGGFAGLATSIGGVVITAFFVIYILTTMNSTANVSEAGQTIVTKGITLVGNTLDLAWLGALGGVAVTLIGYFAWRGN